MTKRLTITLVALALFVLIAVLPASAIYANPATGLFNGSVIMNGTATVPTVFIGEDQLNITHIIYAGLGDGTGQGYTPVSTKLGWWAPGTFSFPNNPSQIIDVANSMTNFYVNPTTFGPYTGTWYCLTAQGSAISGGTVAAPAAPYGAAFVVADPNQAVAAIDVQANQGQGQDMTGKSVVRGTILTVKVDTNLAAFTNGGRSDNISGFTNSTALVRISQTAASSGPLWEVWTSPAGVAQTTVPVPVAQVPGGASNIWELQNYTVMYTTWGTAQIWTRTYSYNNSIVQAGPDSALATGGFNGQNITAATGLVPGVTQAADVLTNANNQNFTPRAGNADGFITIRLKDESGQVQTRVFTNAVPQSDTTLRDLWVNLQPWYLGTFNGNNGITGPAIGWNTGAVDAGLGTLLYPAGTYTIWSETTLSRMMANYKLNGADYTGKTLSGAGTVTIVSDTVKIEANKESVVRSKPFSVTITGRPLTTYWVWVKGTSSMSGIFDNQPPMVGLFQAGVYNDTPSVANQNANNFPLGQYVGENFVNRVLMQPALAAQSDVAMDPSIYNRTRYYFLINTTSSGTRTVEFVTSNWTKAQTYTIRVERDTSVGNQGTNPFVNANPGLRTYKSDEVDVKVEKGAVTITAAGDQSYYLGEEIKFSGTNTETQTTFLFICGPNLNTQGSTFVMSHNIAINQDPRRTRIDNVLTDAENGVAADYVQRAVNADNTWDWKWGTANWALDAGTYTVYAVSGPNNAQNLANVAYGTVSIIIKKPFISATASQSTVAQGDKLFVTGTAEGKPQTGIAIWILGKNYAQRVTQSVNSDASFSYEITTATTALMDAGQYFVVAQHPMQNQVFDIAMCPGSTTTVCNLQQGAAGAANSMIFTLLGAGSLQGTDAAEALVQGINSPNVDDTYTKLVFLVEVPSIRIDPVGDRHVGDKFTITATTNLAVDDDVQMTVVSSSFKPTQKSQSGEFSGASGTVKVTKGDTGLNKISFDVDASTFKPDEYIVTANRILLPAATATALFNVLEGTAPTAVPTQVVTVAPTAAAQTTVATQVPTATPTKTPTQPGFGALVALIGLGAVAFFVVRRH